MLHQLHSNAFSRYILYILLGTFTFTTSIPLNADITSDYDFACRMENAQDVIQELCESKNVKKIVDYFFVLKADIESQYHIKIDLDEYFNILHEYLENNSIHISKKNLDVIKIKFKMREMKCTDSPYITSSTPYIWDLTPYTTDGTPYITEIDPFNTKVGNGPGQCEYDSLPSDFIAGVTMSLCGLLFMFIPIPGLQTFGTGLAGTGATMAITSLCRENDERNYPNSPIHPNHGSKLTPY